MGKLLRRALWEVRALKAKGLRGVGVQYHRYEDPLKGNHCLESSNKWFEGCGKGMIHLRVY